MQQKIYKNKEGNLVIEIPWQQKRFSPYDEDGGGWLDDNIIAVIEKNKNCNVPEMGFAYRIDMSYAGKDDQWTDFFFKYFGEQEEFEKLCGELKLDIVRGGGVV